MYTPSTFKETNWNKIKEVINTYSFATVISNHQNRSIASHLPLILTEDGEDRYLTGHVSNGNEIVNPFKEGNEVLCIFQGPHSYISSSWYNHMNVSTWNYIAIHTYGKPVILNDEELMESLNILTNKYESKSENPLTMDKMPKEYVYKSIKAITGFKIKIERFEASFKLSQNRDPQSYQNIIHELLKTGNEQSVLIAQEMRKHIDQ